MKDYSLNWKDWTNSGVTILGVGIPTLSIIGNFGNFTISSLNNIEKPPFSGISNYDNNICLNRCYINAYIHLLHEIPEIKQFVSCNKFSHEVFDKLNSVFLKMDKCQFIAHNDEDYKKFCDLIGHCGRQHSYDDVSERLNRICLDKKIIPNFESIVPVCSVMVQNSQLFNNVEGLVKNELSNSILVRIDRSGYNSWNREGSNNIIKDCTKVDIPDTVQNSCGQSLKLMGVMYHLGNSGNFGHYTTVKRDKNNNWWYCNDDEVTLQNKLSKYLNMSNYARENAVMLYYKAES